MSRMQPVVSASDEDIFGEISTDDDGRRGVHDVVQVKYRRSVPASELARTTRTDARILLECRSQVQILIIIIASYFGRRDTGLSWSLPCPIFNDQQ